MKTDLAAGSAWLAEQWSDGLAEVIATLISARPAVHFELTTWPGAPAPVGAPQGDIQGWHQVLDILPGPAIWVGAAPAAFTALSGLILEALGVDAADEKDIRSTWLDLVAQAGNVLTQRIAGACKKPITCGPVQDASSPLAPVQAFVDVTMAGKEPVRILMGFSRQLLDIISSPPEPALAAPENQTALRHNALDVQLKMVVTLGRTTLPLGEIFRLSTGAIIEFPQSIAQHAEVLINGRLVGRGQVVVSNGNYAIQLVSTTFKNTGGSI